MRILLLSCNTGEGHNSTAKAIMEVLEARGVECQLRDVLACLSPRFSKFICGWHSRLYRYAPRLSDASYRAMEKIGAEQEETPIYDILSLGAGKLWEMLMEGDYDAVICVHVFSGMMMTEVRRAWGITIPCYFVATDYTCSPTVEQCEMDGYFIPAKDLAAEFIAADPQRHSGAAGVLPAGRSGAGPAGAGAAGEGDHRPHHVRQYGGRAHAQDHQGPVRADAGGRNHRGHLRQ